MARNKSRASQNEEPGGRDELPNIDGMSLRGVPTEEECRGKIVLFWEGGGKGRPKGPVVLYHQLLPEDAPPDQPYINVQGQKWAVTQREKELYEAKMAKVWGMLLDRFSDMSIEEAIEKELAEQRAIADEAMRRSRNLEGPESDQGDGND